MSLPTTNSVVSKVFLVKKLNSIGFSKKSIFTDLLKRKKFDGFLNKYEEPLNLIVCDIEDDFRKFIKQNRKLIMLEELKILEEKSKKDIEKARKELESEPNEPVEGVEEDIESDVEPDVSDKEESSELEKYKAEIDFLNEQLLEKNDEIKKLKKLNFSLTKKLNLCGKK
jgi:hypothetical protein